jgi:flagellar biosynthesis protein FlhG
LQEVKLDNKEIRDQAASLRKKKHMESNMALNETMDGKISNNSKMRVLSVTSGKGGVGKTNFVTNLAYVLSKFGKNVYIFDADIGLANIDVLLGLTPEYNLQHVLNGEKSINEIIVNGPGNIKIFPASSGIQELSELNDEQKIHLLSEFGSLKDEIDFMFIDTGAGISSNVMYFNMAAREKIVVVTPEPTSITDAYAIMKVMSKKYSIDRFKLVANQVKNEAEADELYANLNSVAERFLDVTIDFTGYICMDNHIVKSVRKQKLVTELYPESPSSLCFVRLAKAILENPPDDSISGNIEFSWNNLLDVSS